MISYIFEADQEQIRKHLFTILCFKIGVRFGEQHISYFSSIFFSSWDIVYTRPEAELETNDLTFSHKCADADYCIRPPALQKR